MGRVSTCWAQRRTTCRAVEQAATLIDTAVEEVNHEHMRRTHRCRFLHRCQSDGPVPAFGTLCSKPNEFPFRLGEPERAVPRQAPAASASPFDLRYEDQKLKPVMADLSQLCPNNWLPTRSAESCWLPTPKPNAFRPGQIETRREPPGHSEITPSCLVMRRSAVRIRSQAPFQIDVRRECSDRTVVLQINRSAERSALPLLAPQRT